MSRNLVPQGLRLLLNEKLKEQGWDSVRSFALNTKMASSDTYTVETITRAFCERAEAKGTELSTLASILRHLNTPLSEIREILETYYPLPKEQMFWSLLGTMELELTTFERLLINWLRDTVRQYPDKREALYTGLASSMKAAMLVAGIDATDDIDKMMIVAGG